MRIAHVLGSLGMGGAERVALDLAVMQRQMGHEVVILVLAEPGGPMLVDFQREALPLEFVAKRPGLDWSLPPRVAHKLRALNIEVAHTHNTGPLVYATAAARLAGLRVVHTKHGEGHLHSRAGKMLRKLGAPFAHYFVAVSEATAEHARLQRVYPFADRLRVIDNGIRLDLFYSDAKAKQERRRELCLELGIDDASFLLGSVGRVDANKNHRFLIDVLEEIEGEGAGPQGALHLVIAGDGEKMQALRSRAAASKRAAQIHLLGRRQDVPGLLAAFDAMALPSRSEGLPLVVLEAMASYTPSLASAVGGIPRVIDDRTSGRLLPPDDLIAWVDALNELRQSPEEASRMATKALDSVRRCYSAKAMAERYLELYCLS